MCIGAGDDDFLLCQYFESFVEVEQAEAGGGFGETDGLEVVFDKEVFVGGVDADVEWAGYGGDVVFGCVFDEGLEGEVGHFAVHVLGGQVDCDLDALFEAHVEQFDVGEQGLDFFAEGDGWFVCLEQVAEDPGEVFDEVLGFVGAFADDAG